MYGLGKDIKEIKKHYKTTWTLKQRVLWIPVFRNCFNRKYKILAYLSYFSFFVLVVSIIMLFVLYPFEDSYSYTILFNFVLAPTPMAHVLRGYYADRIAAPYRKK
jgi:hypothetical protein